MPSDGSYSGMPSEADDLTANESQPGALSAREALKPELKNIAQPSTQRETGARFPQATSDPSPDIFSRDSGVDPGFSAAAFASPTPARHFAQRPVKMAVPGATAWPDPFLADSGQRKEPRQEEASPDFDPLLGFDSYYFEI